MSADKSSNKKNYKISALRKREEERKGTRVISRAVDIS